MTHEPLTVRQWTDIVRRARLGRTVKSVALLLATYADADGTRVFPGIARIAVDCELSYNVVKAALAELRTTGLIALVRRAGRPGHADEYRLDLPADLLDRVEVWTPAQVQVATNQIRAKKPWGGKKSGPSNPEPRPTGRAEVDGKEMAPRPTSQAEVPVDNSSPRPTREAEVAPAAVGTSAHLVGSSEETSAHLVGRPRPTPCPPTYQDHDTRTTSHEMAGVVTQLAVVGDTGPPQDRISPSRPRRCAHGIRIRHRPDGTSNCALCRRQHAPPAPDNVIPFPLASGGSP